MVSLVLLAPLAGAVAMLMVGRRMPRFAVSAICCGAVLLAFANSLILPEGRYMVGEWMPAIGANWSFLVDSLSLTMIRMVCGIATLIHIYAIGYMAEDRSYHRFFGYLNLFVFFMLLLVAADNYALAFAGWEGVGLASYLLIGFFIDDPAAGTAANKAFLTNRIGDLGLLIAMSLMIATTGSVAYDAVFRQWPSTYLTPLVTLLFVAAIGKSAQLPLYTWLPDAMVGPTPVSALIHAATMVTAGVYLMVRSAPLFDGGMTLIRDIGLLTALVGALLACVQLDIKRVLAFSTMSQLGLMFVAVGLGAPAAAMLHLLTHAFFKALLFLGAGSVIHGLHGEQDLRFMGGLRRTMPATFWMMAIGAAALAGVPGFSGFFSKEQIVTAAFAEGAIGGAGVLIVSMLTAFYMTRLMRLAFLGATRTATTPHESSRVMLAPMAVLAIGSIIAGWGPMHVEWLPLAGALAATAIGASVAMSGFEAPLALGHLHILDRVYRIVIVRGFAQGGGRLLGEFDRRWIDGGVNGAGVAARLVSHASILWDNRVIDGLVRTTGAVVRLSSYPARLLQTGSLQEYAWMILAGLAAITGWILTRSTAG